MILSKIENVQPEQQPISVSAADSKHVSPAIGNTNVASSAVSDTYLMDCIEGMKHYPNKYFDLAVVDPPYGIDVEIKQITTGRNKHIPQKGYAIKDWDKCAPKLEYFCELFRISKNQIVWGANHFISRMPYDASCWLVWDKENGDNGYADCELAWTSFSRAVRMVKYKWHGMLQKDMKNKEVRIHPTQKPVGLYDWIFTKFAEPGMKVLDTHLGSGSSRIAAHKNKLNFVGFEIDKEYYDKQEKRFADYVSQLTLF